jgi:hypothetical protein
MLRGLLALLVVLALTTCNGARLLMFGYDGMTSHILVMSKVARKLVDDGHEVTVVVTSHDARKANLTGLEILYYDGKLSNPEVQDVYLKMLTQESPLSSVLHLLDLQEQVCVSASFRIIIFLVNLPTTTQSCRLLLANENLWTSLRTRAFDLAVIDNAFGCARIVVDILRLDKMDISLVGFFDP